MSLIAFHQMPFEKELKVIASDNFIFMDRNLVLHLNGCLEHMEYLC